MNKYFILIGILVALILGSVFYTIFSAEEGVTVGKRTDITVTFDKQLRSFVPDTINITEGDSVHITFVNEDVAPHGIAIDAYGVTKYAPPQSTVSLPPFLATQVGNFTFYCPVPVSSHLNEIGRLVVLPSRK